MAAKAVVEKASSLALGYRRQTYHFSESVFLAMNETFKITDPEMVRIVTGYHGGGEAYRKASKVDLTATLEELASGRDRRDPKDLPVKLYGHLCGALAAGIVSLGFLFASRHPSNDLTLVDELSYEFHSRFDAEFGTKVCGDLRQRFVPASNNHTFEYIYQKATSIAVELILDRLKMINRRKTA